MLVDATFNFPGQFGITSALGTGAPGTGPFCLEGYLYVGSAWTTLVNGNLGMAGMGSGTDVIDLRLRSPITHSDTSPTFELSNGTSTAANTREVLAKLTWYHWAFCRDSNSDIWLFINGKKSTLPLNDTINITNLYNIRLGCSMLDVYSFISNVDNCRLTTGWSRYTSDFVPPTAPMPYP